MIAHVGAYRPFSEQDSTRVACVMVEMLRLGRKLPSAEKIDIINLEYGRDFLKEKLEYEMVVLHSIFYHQTLKHSQLGGARNISVSPKHTIENWRKRLLTTKATYIALVAGKQLCLEGWHIGQLEGYEILVRDHIVTIYVKVGTQ